MKIRRVLTYSCNNDERLLEALCQSLPDGEIQFGGLTISVKTLDLSDEAIVEITKDDICCWHRY